MLLTSGRWTAAQNPAAARNIAYCITQLALTDKAVRRLGEQWRSYQVALADVSVLAHFQAGRRPSRPHSQPSVAGYIIW